MAVRGIRGEIAVLQHIGVPDTILSGALAGTIAGVFYALFAMGTATLSGADIVSPFRLTGATFVGTSALQGGAGVVAYGLLLHLITAAAAGLAFAVVLPREASVYSALGAGLIYGLIVMLVMQHFVLPAVNPAMHDAIDGTPSVLIAHLIYGGSLASVPMLRNQFAHV